jgi:hypothetical protein
MKTLIYEVIVEENGKAEQQYIGEDDQLALEILRSNAIELRREIKAGKAKVSLMCK